MRVAIRLVLLVLVLVSLAAESPATQPRPRPGRPITGFRLFARSAGALAVNRAYCGLLTSGQICADTSFNRASAS